MKSLANVKDKDQVLRRLAGIGPESERLWGSMSAHGMMVHLIDAFEISKRKTRLQPRGNRVSQLLMKSIALYLPAPWPKDIKTLPEVDQDKKGSKLKQFEVDKNALIEMIEWYSRAPKDYAFQPHPIFGRLTVNQWQRWGYLHVDHHLRQFGR